MSESRVSSNKSCKPRIWDYAVLVAICVTSVIAGVGLYCSMNRPNIHVFQSRTFDIAGAITIVLVLVYLARDTIASILMKARRHNIANRTQSQTMTMRTFAAGGFALIFLQGLIQGLCEFGGSIVAGKPAWLMLAGHSLWGSVGVALGLALLSGSQGILPWVRGFLMLMVAGDCISIVMPLLDMSSAQEWRVTSDMIVNIMLLWLFSLGKVPWVRPTPK